MPRSIHQRVRAALEAKERAERKAADAAHDRRMAALERRDARREARIDGIINGTIIPRTAEEEAIQWRALYGDVDDASELLP